MIKFLPLLLTACVSTTQSSAPDSSVNGCCQGFLSEPQTPIWYRDLDESAGEDARLLCESGGGKWSFRPCDVSEVVGGCLFSGVALPYIQLFPVSVYGDDPEPVAGVYCSPGEGVLWIDKLE